MLKGDWITKVTILQEVQGESTSSVTALFGSLAEYESTLLAQRAPQAALKAKNLALVAPSKERYDDDDDDDDDDEEDLDDEEMTMMVRKFKKFFRKKGVSRKENQAIRRKGPLFVSSARSLVISRLSTQVFRDSKGRTKGKPSCPQSG